MRRSPSSVEDRAYRDRSEEDGQRECHKLQDRRSNGGLSARIREGKRVRVPRTCHKVRRPRLSFNLRLTPGRKTGAGRFTANWIAANVPYLHPGQIPALIDEFHRRGWSDEDIALRVEPYMPLMTDSSREGSHKTVSS